MKKTTLLSILILCLSFSAMAAGKLNINVPLTAGSFQIEAKKIKGKVKQVAADTYKASKLQVRVKDMKTGMDLRDEHMKNEDRLHMKKYPTISVTKVMAKGGKGTGIIEIKGKKEKINFSYKVSGSNMTAIFDLNLTKFPLKNLKYLGVGAQDIVKVTAVVPVAK